tara:strand:- start:3 stop:308 length:306 start_codon:yes stop_codon:yes gene_type:complete
MPKSITGEQLRNTLFLYSNIEKKDSEVKINPNIVSASEIEEYFDISKSEMMSTIYYRMVENCNSSHHGIMRNPEHSAMSDFFELLKNNIDIRSYYKQKFKL